jgi:chromosome segregation ATPase
MKESSARRDIGYIKTAKGQGLRAIPRKQDDYSYLDLYVLDKEKERMEKELSQLGKRGERARKRLEEIKLKMEKIEVKMGKLKEKSEDRNEGQGKERVGGETAKKDWKVMPISY